MSSELPGGFDYGTLKTAAMVVFFAVFMGILLWLVLSKSSTFRRMSRLPLEEEPPTENRN